MKEFKDNLKYLRKKSKLTQEELSKKLNISRQTLSYYETGSREPDINMLISISNFFDCSVDFLLSGNLNSNNLDFENILNAELFSKNNLLRTLKDKKEELKFSLNELEKLINLLENNLDNS